MRLKFNRMSQRKMISWSDGKCQAAQTQDAAAQDKSCIRSVLQIADKNCMDANHSFTTEYSELVSSCSGGIICAEDDEKPCFSFYNQGYVEKIKEFEFYVDMVKKIARPGCEAQVLDVALAQMLILFETLTLVSSCKPNIRASL
ncbi:pyrophosphate--fructose 6-phosphate1-phosphotransferase subunit alpha 1 [Striga asiatica]|uniref:Pyrophosphate--fructose 6-phosphate1-phosphotransferase subunit alpha 1 n=1 Tax=Striga asiatica TaxID=4170 RepID=A0A5A7QIM4_STRAF|nr:pyrophosphate--fructose 6-phosphate1-phosphotransferase subunit alpha 1 [Striga asiatica]